MQKAYNLSIRELLILLSLRGATSVFGLFDGSDAECDRKTVNENLFNMQKHGIISLGSEGGKVSIDEGIEKILDVMIASDSVTVLMSKDETIPNQCIYTEKKHVYCRYLPGNDRIYIVSSDYEDIWGLLTGTGWGKISGEHHDDTGQAVKAEDIPRTGEFRDEMSEIIKAEGIRAAAFIMDKTGECAKQLLVYDRNLDERIIIRDETDAVSYVYSENTLRRGLEALLDPEQSILNIEL